jgi:hypothetical protein
MVAVSSILLLIDSSLGCRSLCRSSSSLLFQVSSNDSLYIDLRICCYIHVVDVISVGVQQRCLRRFVVSIVKYAAATRKFGSLCILSIPIDELDSRLQTFPAAADEQDRSIAQASASEAPKLARISPTSQASSPSINRTNNAPSRRIHACIDLPTSELRPKHSLAANSSK